MPASSFLPAWGSSWEYTGFSCDQKHCDSSCAYCLHYLHLLWSEYLWKAVWCARLAHACAQKIMGAFSLHIFPCVCVDSKYPNTPNWSSMANNAITWGGGLGSPLYICGCFALTCSTQEGTKKTCPEYIQLSRNKMSFCLSLFSNLWMLDNTCFDEWGLVPENNREQG